MKLRTYQQSAVDSVYAYLNQSDGNPCVVIPTGGGKTPVLSRIAKDVVGWGGRILILSHVKELLEQAAEKLRMTDSTLDVGVYSAGLKKRQTKNKIIVAGIQSVYRRAVELGAFDLIIIDECFVEGTMISTPGGDVPIEEIVAGGFVHNAFGVGKVLATSAKPARKTITLEFDDGTEIECTENHKLFTENGWSEAGALELGEKVYCEEDVRVLRETVHSIKESEGVQLEKAEVLFNILLEEAGELYAHAGGEGKGIQNPQKEGITTKEAWGERKTATCLSENTSGSIGTGLGGRVGDCNQKAKADVPIPLQGRFSERISDGSDRDRRSITSDEGQERTGYKEDEASCGVRLVRITHNEEDSNRVVYNLHVDGHPSYYANGLLAHNCHLIPEDGEGMYRTFLAAAKAVNPKMRIVGLTATPYRMTTGYICGPDNILTEICYEIGIKDLIQQGYLCPLVSKNGNFRPNVSKLHKRGGEYIDKEVQEMFDAPDVVELAVEDFIYKSKDRKKILIFCAGVEHAYHVKQVLEEEYGAECGLVEAKTPPDERRGLIARFKNGGLNCMINVNVLTIGFDAPNIDCIILLRSTLSCGLFYQMCGRGLRISEGKKNCLVLDYGLNVETHGPIDMLQIDEKPGTSGVAPVKECKNCQVLVPIQARICENCGHVFEINEKDDLHDYVSTKQGILSGEVTKEEFEVTSTTYRVHHKKGASEDAPTSMRVDYERGIVMEPQSEWICFDHKGQARKKAELWWEHRTNYPVPDTTQQAVDLARTGILGETKSITVKTVAGEKFPRIVAYRITPIDEDAVDWATKVGDVNLDDVPF